MTTRNDSRASYSALFNRETLDQRSTCCRSAVYKDGYELDRVTLRRQSTAQDDVMLHQAQAT
jgi:hypothetical protein